MNKGNNTKKWGLKFKSFSFNTSLALLSYVQTTKLESWSCKSLLLKRTKSGKKEAERRKAVCTVQEDYNKWWGGEF